MKKKRLAAAFLAAALGAAAVFSGCGGAAKGAAVSGSSAGVTASGSSEGAAGGTPAGNVGSAASGEAFSGVSSSSGQSADSSRTNASKDEAPQIGDLKCESVMELHHATGFNVFYYEDGYKVIDVASDKVQYLIVPEGKEAPSGLADSVTVIQQPLSQIYLAATGAMTFFDKLGEMDAVTMTGTDASGWTIQAAVDALNSGKMTFAGKYSAPDYEMLVQKNCDLALESGMIMHAPDVKEMIEDLNIPVMIDRSSYESDPLGRSEWVKVYGALLNREDQAQKLYEEQETKLNALPENADTGKTVAFFAVNSDGNISVRKPNDVVATMIRLAGGRYVCDDLKTDDSSASTTTDISMEEFYSRAVDADYLIYNGTIEQALGSVNDLIAKNELFSQFKAVKDGNVWQIGKEWYQSTLTGTELATDMNHMLSGQDTDRMSFLSKVG